VGNKPFTAADNKVGLLFTMVFDIQILLGLIIFFTKGWFGVLTADFGAAMSNGATRFFTLEHPSLMLLAVIFAHIGRAKSKRQNRTKRSMPRQRYGTGCPTSSCWHPSPGRSWPTDAPGCACSASASNRLIFR